MSDFNDLFEAAKAAEELRAHERAIAQMLEDSLPILAPSTEVVTLELLLIGVLIAVALGLLFRIRSSRHARAQLEILPAHVQQSLMTLSHAKPFDGRKGDHAIQAMQALLTLNDLYGFQSTLKIGDREVPLSSDEHAVIRWIQLKVSNEELADLLNVSLSKVYQIRRNLRSKLSLSRSQSLEIELATATVQLGQNQANNTR